MCLHASSVSHLLLACIDVDIPCNTKIAASNMIEARSRLDWPSWNLSYATPEDQRRGLTCDVFGRAGDYSHVQPVQRALAEVHLACRGGSGSETLGLDIGPPP